MNRDLEKSLTLDFLDRGKIRVSTGFNDRIGVRVRIKIKGRVQPSERWILNRVGGSAYAQIQDGGNRCIFLFSNRRQSSVLKSSMMKMCIM